MQKMQCYKAYLETVLQAQGSEQALTALEQITAQDGEALREAHPLVHHIGQQSYTKYGTATEAMAHCRDVFWSGCYHGVLRRTPAASQRSSLSIFFLCVPRARRFRPTRSGGTTVCTGWDTA
ncbi:MAG: hypothetical protein U0231_04625 [Nitrospiraceae bacterium]